MEPVEYVEINNKIRIWIKSFISPRSNLAKISKSFNESVGEESCFMYKETIILSSLPIVVNNHIQTINRYSCIAHSPNYLCCLKEITKKAEFILFLVDNNWQHEAPLHEICSTLGTVSCTILTHKMLDTGIHEICWYGLAMISL